MKKPERIKKGVCIVPAFLCAAFLLAACGGKQQEVNAPAVEPIEAVTETAEEPTEQPAPQPEEPAEQPSTQPESPVEADVITEDQAYDAVINYNKAIGSGYDEDINSDGYSEYWSVYTEDDGKIVVLYRSYTAAQIRYYVDPVSGETYVTELVPGIIDEEQENGEKFNARDYID